MAAKRDWVKTLKAMQKEPRALTPAECVELILLIGGTPRPRGKPPVKIPGTGYNRREMNWGAIGNVVFSFLENAERLSQLEAKIQELSSTDFMGKYLAALPRRWSEVHASKMTAKDRAAAVRITKENVADELQYLRSTIEMLRPISAKSANDRTAAEHMAAAWFAERGVEITRDQIKNQLGALRERAGLKRLELAEWRVLWEKQREKAKEEAMKMLQELKALDA